MSLSVARTLNFAQSILLSAVAGALLSSPIAARAASKTLTISGTPAATVTVMGEYSFQPIATDTVQSRIKFDIYNKPDWATFDGTTGRLAGRPNRRQVGTYKDITIRLTDWYGYVTTAPFSITVVNAPSTTPAAVNPAPTISGNAPRAVTAGTAYTFTPHAADANGGSLSFSIQNLPGWAKFNTASGTLSGSPGEADVGTYANIQISVSDGNSRAALAPFTIAVNQMSSGNVAVDWMPPTVNTDGSVLTDLAGYKVYYGSSPDALTQVINVTNAGLSSLVVDDLAPGTWYFSIASYNSLGAESSRLGTVSTTVL